MIEEHQIEKWKARIILFLDKEQGVNRDKVELARKKHMAESFRGCNPMIDDYSINIGGGRKMGCM